jgi:hypothetical protein
MRLTTVKRTQQKEKRIVKWNSGGRHAFDLQVDDTVACKVSCLLIQPTIRITSKEKKKKKKRSYF